MPIWNPKIETLPREMLEQIQTERLESTLNRVYKNVPFYRASFERHSIVPEDISSMADLARLPFTVKADLRDNYPYDMFSSPLKDIVRIHASSGTTGKPTVVGYTRNDLAHWTETTARVLSAGGVTRHDILQISFDYGLFTGGIGMHYGAEEIGATVIPASAGNARRQVAIMKDYRTTGLLCTPSYALHLAETLEYVGVSVEELALRIGLLGAEPWSESMRQDIEQRLGISATDNYGLSEVMGPGVAGECECKNGLHLAEDHFIAEIIDPDTGESLPEGRRGELVLTTITKEALPLVRFRTGDLTAITREPCDCGRTHARISRITGRTDDMVIVQGVNVYPSQIESVLGEIEGTAPDYQLVIERVGGLDELEVWVEVPQRLFADEMRKLRAFEEELRDRIRGALGLDVKVRLVEPRTIERQEGKAGRVVDRRPKG